MLAWDFMFSHLSKSIIQYAVARVYQYNIVLIVKIYAIEANNDNKEKTLHSVRGMCLKQ